MERVPALYGMGTTVAGLVVHPDPEAILAFNVGDSRIYAIRADGIEQISVDHTMEVGGIRIGPKPPRVLSQCLGGFLSDQALEPHVLALPLAAGAEFLICSDGLHDMLTDRDIERCLAPDLTASVQTLFEHAMREGGIDNISIIQARVTVAQTA
jgi:serine/threonine protein phosphatase PrpC